MKPLYNELYTSLSQQLNFIEMENEDIIHKTSLSISIIIKVLQKLKSLTIKQKFKSQLEEIEFFKLIKPKFVSNLIYQNGIYTIETHKPHGGEKVVRKYLNNELQKLKRHFDDNLEFYKYYRTNSDYLDHKYFVRGKHDIRFNIDSIYFETDHRFCTSHDFKVATIIANDQIEVYLESELNLLERRELRSTASHKSELNHKSSISWTGSKVALIELLYAFHSDGSFNNGKAELKQIAHFIENTFDIDLGQFNRTFLELRARKMGRTKYLDTLKEKLIKRMDEADDLL